MVVIHLHKSNNFVITMDFTIQLYIWGTTLHSSNMGEFIFFKTKKVQQNSGYLIELCMLNHESLYSTLAITESFCWRIHSYSDRPVLVLIRNQEYWKEKTASERHISELFGRKIIQISSRFWKGVQRACLDPFKKFDNLI